MGDLSPESRAAHRKEYFAVFIVLAVLTLIEVAIPEVVDDYFFKASSLTLLAFGKAFVVAYYYMHLKEETKWLKFIAAFPLIAGVYATFVIVESLYR